MRNRNRRSHRKSRWLERSANRIFLQVVGDLGAVYRRLSRQRFVLVLNGKPYTYQFGPTYAFHLRNATAFAHALFGAVSQKSSADQTLVYTKPMWSVGGGLDFELSRRISIRAAQLDYERQSVPIVDTGGPTPFSPVSVNGLRYSGGVVFHF